MISVLDRRIQCYRSHTTELPNYYVLLGLYTPVMTDALDNTVRTSETTLRIIEAVTSLEEPRIKDVSEQINISESTALRHLSTLEKHSYVARINGRYRLGSAFLDHAGALRTDRVGYEFAERYVDKLINQTNERVQFIIKEGGYRVILFRRTREDTIRTRSRIGKKGLLHSTAGGKAILASLSDREIDSIIDDHGLPARTDHTIVTRDDLFEEIERIRERGFATSHQEVTIGYNAVGSAVQSENGELLGALSVSGPKHRMKGTRLNQEIAELVTNAVEELELKIQFDDTGYDTDTTPDVEVGQ